MSQNAEPIQVLGVEQSVLDLSAYPGACDCHTHVFGDPGHFPFDPDRVFTPGEAPVSALRQRMRALGTERAVIVQPSVYGTDNRCTEDAVRQLGGVARGICVIDAYNITDEELRRLDAAGFRGVRVNLRTAGENDPAILEKQVVNLARRIADLGWHVQIYADRTMLRPLGQILRAIPTPLVLDHFAGITAPDSDDMGQLSSLLETGRAYVKLSAPHRVAEGENYDAVGAIVRRLVQLFPDQLLWGSDWPHPGAVPGRKRVRDVIEPFRAEDDGAALFRFSQWAEDDHALRKILVTNPQTLYKFPAMGNC